jgi:hypothetical protein
MATAESQARWRARDTKSTIELRLSAAAVDRLDKLVARFNARGRAEVIERLLMADPGEHAGLMLNEAIRLGRAYLSATGRTKGALCDTSGRTYVIL